MQGSFEKKVQEKLDELRLTPSAPVWENIKGQIRPEEKRRRGVFRLFFISALLMTSGWWFFTQQTTEKPGRLAHIENDAAALTPQKQQGAESQDMKGATSPGLQQKGVHNEKRTEESKPVVSLPLQKQIVLKKASVPERRDLVYRHSRQNDLGRIDVAKKSNSSFGKSSEPGRETNNAAGKVSQSSNEAMTPTENPTPTKPQATPDADSIAQNKTALPQKEIPPHAVDGSKRKLAAVQKKHLNQILFSAGWSSVLSPASSSPSSFGQNNSTGGWVGNGSNRSYWPAEVTRGFSFALGYARGKELSNRLTLSLGLQYAYYSTRQKVGSFKTVDTTVLLQDKALDISGYYSIAFPGNASGNVVTRNYTNHYHVMEFPVSVQYRLLRKLPIQLSAGLSYGRLLGTNALTFDAASGVYYRSSQARKKNYLNSFVALQYALLNKQEWKLSAGPMLQYNAVTLQKAASQKQRLLFAGIKTAVEF
jgi:hypothetical protein